MTCPLRAFQWPYTQEELDLAWSDMDKAGYSLDDRFKIINAYAQSGNPLSLLSDLVRERHNSLTPTVI